MYERLMEAAVEEENSRQALKAVKRNDGAAGVDRMTTEELEEHLQANWQTLKDKLLKGTYVPSPVRRKEIEAERGDANVGDTDGTGSVHTTDVAASDDADFRSELQRA